MGLQLPLIRPRNGHLPTFERTLAALGPIPNFLFRALEFGASQNRLFFDLLSEKERPRAHLREMIVRDQGKRFLERSEFQVEDEAVTVGNEPLAALVLRCGPVHMRVLKAAAPDGLAPGCGASERRRGFYNQAPSLYLGLDGRTRQTKLNLIYLWTFDDAFNLGQTWLVCPLRAGETPAEVITHFHEPLPHPAVSLSEQAASEQVKQTEDELEDLLRNVPEESEEEEQG
jgi:hypothetical protein